MKRYTLLITLMLALAAVGMARGNAVVGQAAPDFKATDSNGKAVSLSSLKGKWVVLEWYNADCPVSKAKYDDNTMQSLQKKYEPKGVVWLTVCSSAEGKQGFYNAAGHNSTLKQRNATPTAFDIGRAYGAKTTPHMFVINPQGQLVYNGAIDDKAGNNYVDAALIAGMAGRPITTAVTTPYGCSVKYNK
jgi:peroxiredoxin